MKKVMLYAYAGANLGDDLFIKILCERYPETKFIFFAPRKYNKLTSKLKNLSIIPTNSLIVRGLNLFVKMFTINSSLQSHLARYCDLSVQIGGSIFMQREGWEDNLDRKRKMLVKDQPFFVLGANFGPYYDENFYLEHRSVIKRYSDICFRDEYSYHLFSDLTNVRIADDIVFQLDRKVTHVSKRQNIVISVIKPSFRKNLEGLDEIYFHKIKEIAMLFIEKGFEVTFMSFCKGEGDEEAIESIISLIPDNYRNKVKKHYYNLNMEETLNMIASSNFVVATRFHSMILGWLYNKPVYPIAYSEKMTNVMEDINFKDAYSTFDDLDRLHANDVYECINNDPVDISKQVTNSVNHFQELDKLLLNPPLESV